MVKNDKNLEEKKIGPEINSNKNSIDQKAKQFADFFNGEVVDLD